MQEQKDMTGVLFKNNSKETDKHPDYTGKATVDGKEYQISSWVNTSSKGNKYMKLTFQSPKDAQKAELHHLEREFSLTGVTSEYDL